MFIKNISYFIKNITYSLLCLFVIHNVVLADEWTDKLNFNGFFTIDMTVADEDLSLISNSDQTIAYDKNSLNLKNSLLGGQLSYTLTDNFTAVVQGKIYDDGNAGDESDSFAQIDWAYISYDLGADLTARAGRFQIPFMQGTELRSIGFSRLWARPLISSSGAGGFNEYEGIELLKNFSTANGNWSFQLAVGQAEHGRDIIDNKHIEVLSVRYQQNDFWLRSAILSTEYDIFTPEGQLIQSSANAVMLSTEIEYTLDNFLFNAGYSTSKADITPDDTDYYFSLAYHFNTLTPYIFHSRANQFFELFDIPRPNATGVGGQQGPPPPQPPLQTRPQGDVDIYHWAAGVRYNFSERYALKIQAEHIKEENKANLPSNNGEGNAFSIVLEGVF